jgi:DNA-directed RNA polymerase specialized sigma24 family protein
MASETGSVSEWIRQVQSGDPFAAQKLWERYFDRLIPLARKELRTIRGYASDEEDVVLSAFASFCRCAARGQFPQLGDRTDLWRLLVMLTARKAHHVHRDEQRQKRGGRAASLRGAVLELEEIIGREPTPEFAAQVAEECDGLLARLGTAELRSIALFKMEGYTTDEIAVKLGCARSTVERRLRLIRSLWKAEEPPGG